MSRLPAASPAPLDRNIGLILPLGARMMEVRVPRADQGVQLPEADGHYLCPISFDHASASITIGVGRRVRRRVRVGQTVSDTRLVNGYAFSFAPHGDYPISITSRERMMWRYRYDADERCFYEHMLAVPAFEGAIKCHATAVALYGYAYGSSKSRWALAPDAPYVTIGRGFFRLKSRASYGPGELIDVTLRNGTQIKRTDQRITVFKPADGFYWYYWHHADGWLQLLPAEPLQRCIAWAPFPHRAAERWRPNYWPISDPDDETRRQVYTEHVRGVRLFDSGDAAIGGSMFWRRNHLPSDAPRINHPLGPDTLAYRPKGRCSLLTLHRRDGDSVHLFHSCRRWFQVVFTRIS